MTYEEEWRIESFKASITFGGQALKGLFLANGAAAIAMLAFLGNVMSKAGACGDDVKLAAVFANPLVLFASGTVASILAAFFAYVAQTSFTHGVLAVPQLDRMNRIGRRARIACVVVGFLSAALFVWGLVSASIHFDGIPR
jgi:hypothetical protein